MKLGAVLIAAGKNANPLLPSGEITVAQRMIATLQKTGVIRITVVTGPSDKDHSGYGTVRQENGKAACPVWRILSTESTAGKPGYIHFLRHSFPGRNISKEGHDSKRTLQQCSEIILEIIIILNIIVARK